MQKTPVPYYLAALKEEIRPDCKHYWIIDSPVGQKSTGRCKFCGAVREFSNDYKDTFNRTEHPSKSDDVHRFSLTNS